MSEHTETVRRPRKATRSSANRDAFRVGSELGTMSGAELEALLAALQAMRQGDFSARLKGSQTGLAGKIADTFNDIIAANQRMAEQLDRVGDLVGREGKTRHRVKFSLATGAWGEMEG